MMWNIKQGYVSLAMQRLRRLVHVYVGGIVELNQSNLKGELDRWKSTTYGKTCARFPERREKFEGTSGIEVQPVYTPLDTEGIDYLEDLGFRENTHTRVEFNPRCIGGRLWTMRQYAGFATAEESNERYRYLLEQGQTGLSVAFDLPTQIGYDSDHELALGEVGKVGGWR